jgi:hypothetical protein
MTEKKCSTCKHVDNSYPLQLCRAPGGGPPKCRNYSLWEPQPNEPDDPDDEVWYDSMVKK